MPDVHGLSDPSPWVAHWAGLLTPAAQVLDVACGSGRHMRCLAERGHSVLGVDRDAAGLELASQWGEVLQADLESGPWPLEGRAFGGIVVTNYLWRPLLRPLLRALAPGGVLIYETFALPHASVGRPSRPDFLLRPGELIELAVDLHIVAYEDGYLGSPDRFVQRIAAVRPPIGLAKQVRPPQHRLRG